MINITKSKIALSFLIGATLLSCSNSELSESTAQDVVASYIKKNPDYETTKIDLTDIKLDAKKEATQIEEYKKLALEGYIEFTEQKYKKQFLSKDSSWYATIKLTGKSADFILNTKGKKAEVKTILFNNLQSTDIESTRGKKAKVKAKITKIKTPFYFLGKDKNMNVDILIKDFTLKYKKDMGWVIDK